MNQWNKNYKENAYKSNVHLSKATYVPKVYCNILWKWNFLKVNRDFCFTYQCTEKFDQGYELNRAFNFSMLEYEIIINFLA